MSCKVQLPLGILQFPCSAIYSEPNVNKNIPSHSSMFLIGIQNRCHKSGRAKDKQQRTNHQQDYNKTGSRCSTSLSLAREGSYFVHTTPENTQQNQVLYQYKGKLLLTSASTLKNFREPLQRERPANSISNSSSCDVVLCKEKDTQNRVIVFCANGNRAYDMGTKSKLRRPTGQN